MVQIPTAQIGSSGVEFMVNGQPFRRWTGHIEYLKLDDAINMTILIREHMALKLKGPDFDMMAKQLGFPLS